jgi:hypothetical protein
LLSPVTTSRHANSPAPAAGRDAGARWRPLLRGGHDRHRSQTVDAAVHRGLSAGVPRRRRRTPAARSAALRRHCAHSTLASADERVHRASVAPHAGPAGGGGGVAGGGGAELRRPRGALSAAAARHGARGAAPLQPLLGGGPRRRRPRPQSERTAAPACNAF